MPKKRPIRIKTIEELYQAAQGKRCITCGHIHKYPKPASWIINYPGWVLVRMFQSGIYLYQPKKPSRLRSPKPATKSKFWTWNRPTPATPPDNTH